MQPIQLLVETEAEFDELRIDAFNQTRHRARPALKEAAAAALALHKAGYGYYEPDSHVTLSSFYSEHGYFTLGTDVFRLIEEIQHVGIPLRRAATVPSGALKEMRAIAEAHGALLTVFHYPLWPKPLVILR